MSFNLVKVVGALQKRFENKLMVVLPVDKWELHQNKGRKKRFVSNDHRIYTKLKVGNDCAYSNGKDDKDPVGFPITIHKTSTMMTTAHLEEDHGIESKKTVISHAMIEITQTT